MPLKKHNFRYLSIKEQDVEYRPREKLIEKGAENLTKAELLGIIIGSGIENLHAVDLGSHILRSNDNSFHKVSKLSVKELQQFKGIGEAKATILASVMEIARRMHDDATINPIKLSTPEDIHKFMKGKLMNRITEEFWIILLNSANHIIKAMQISKGGIDEATVDPKVIFKQSFLHNATKIILVHNHPSGNTEPSSHDIQVTSSIASVTEQLGFTFVDHIIVGETKHFSFQENGFI